MDCRETGLIASRALESADDRLLDDALPEDRIPVPVFPLRPDAAATVSVSADTQGVWEDEADSAPDEGESGDSASDMLPSLRSQRSQILPLLRAAACTHVTESAAREVEYLLTEVAGERLALLSLLLQLYPGLSAEQTQALLGEVLSPGLSQAHLEVTQRLTGNSLRYGAPMPTVPSGPLMVGTQGCFVPLSLRAGLLQVLFQVHPSVMISVGALELLHQANTLIFEKLVRTAIACALITRPEALPPLLVPGDIEAAAGRILRHELAKHAIAESRKAVAAGGTKLVVDASACARAASRWAAVTPAAAVSLAAMWEYMLAEVLELSGNAARDNRKTTIVPRHCMLAIACDEELSGVYRRAGALPLSPGGTLPSIRRRSLPTTVPAPAPAAAAGSGARAAAARPAGLTVALRAVRRAQREGHDRWLPADVFGGRVRGACADSCPVPAVLQLLYERMPTAAQRILHAWVEAELVRVLQVAGSLGEAMTAQEPWLRSAAVRLAADLTRQH